MTIEVFKTNVTEQVQAFMLIAQIQQSFSGYKANFDLDDCDRILRIKCDVVIEPNSVIELLKDFGYTAEVLKDIIDNTDQSENIFYCYNFT